MTFLLGLVGTGVPDLATEWRRAPLVGIAVALEGSIPDALEDALRVSVGLAGALVLVAAISTSISGIGRLTYSLGTHDMLPHAFARLSRRTLIAPVAILSAAVAAVALLVAGNVGSGEVSFLASLYSFGILLAFTAAQLAVIALRFREPSLPRPFRAPGDVRIRGVAVPLPALVGAPLTFVLWIAVAGDARGCPHRRPALAARRRRSCMSRSGARPTKACSRGSSRQSRTSFPRRRRASTSASSCRSSSG